MTRYSILLLPFFALGLTACGAERTNTDDTGWEETDTDTDTDSDTDSDTDTDTDTDTDADYFEPVAIGLEYTGGWDPVTDELTSYFFDGYEYGNYVLGILADTEFFSLSGDDQVGHYCEIVFEFDWAPSSFKSYGPGNPDGANPWATPGDQALTWGEYEGTLTYLYATDDTLAVCENLDPATWTDGSPYATFDQMHYGVAFGALSPYLEDLFGEDTMAEAEDSLFTSYTAINHPADGGGLEFFGYDWVYSFLFAWDDTTHEVEVDADDYLVYTPHYDGGAGGYVRSGAYWYEDFPNLDLTAMADQ